MKKILLAGFFAAISLNAVFVSSTEFKVGQPIPDELKLKEEQFANNKVFRSLSFIDKYLSSFGKLTYLIENKIHFRNSLQEGNSGDKNKNNLVYTLNLSLKELSEVKNLDWEIQQFGFHNHFVSVKGTLLYQQARIRELEYELQRLKKTDETEIKNAKKAVDESRKLLNDYIKKQSWLD